MRKLIRGLFVVNFLIEFSFCFFSQSFSAESDALFLLRIQNRALEDSEEFTFDTKDGIVNTTFDKTKSIIFQVHGYLENKDIEAQKNLSEAILEKFDTNLFFIDWGKGARTLDYSLAKGRVYDVARVLGDFIMFLHEEHGVDFKKVVCIGFSLGAQICGNIGQYLENNKMLKVIGLDPARALFDVQEPSTRINPESADYVECIHTGYSLGIRAPICQADFFMNKGSHQPGCENFLGIDNVVCSHYRAIWYYIEALQNPEAFYGKSCSDFKDVLSGNCNEISGEFMGNKNNKDKKITGIYQVFTNKESPYGRGKN